MVSFLLIANLGLFGGMIWLFYRAIKKPKK